MPRATHPGPAALRNRNRVTNKTRLKVIRDSIEADSIVLDEDEEKARVVSTAGVDAEDANEHHLQAVLSAAASRHQATARSTRSGAKDKESPPAAYIPTPDSTGIVQNYEGLYVPGRWKDPVSYVKSSDTVEEAISCALANGFIYYMDERDKEWLDKNNEQARGEGMSTQGATSGSTRSGRSAKAKGKEPDVLQAVPITEDEFELVMGIFEKITHEKTEFLHHGLEQGAPFPPFSDYQDTFSNKLQSDIFAVYDVPGWVPPPQLMLRFARIIYSYWRERRLERGGHRIIPVVNLDESDTKNESYICFRRREIKAVRKTRASQASYSDRLVRLQSELSTALDLVRSVHQRETCKRESNSHNHVLWDKRRTFADLKRAHPSLGSKEEDELFMDKEKPPKKPKVDASRPSLKLRHPREHGEVGSPVAPQLPHMRPKDRTVMIQAQIDQELLRCKERDNKWEDSSDYPYQAEPTLYGHRLFKPISPKQFSHTEDGMAPYKYEVRLRTGRGGRKTMDRRPINCRLRAASFTTDSDAPEVQELLRKTEERYRYDDDSGISIGALSVDEHDRKLIDECQPRQLMVAMSIYQTEDYQKLVTDPTLRLASGDVRPFHLGPLPPMVTMRPPTHPGQRQPSVPPVQSISSAGSTQAASHCTNAPPVSMQTQVKKLPTTSNPIAHLRISSGSRAGQNGSHLPTSPHATPPSSASVNGFADAQGSLVKTEQDVKRGSPIQPDVSSAVMASPSPVPSKPLNSATLNVPNLPNGYHIPTVNGYPQMPKGGYMPRQNALGIQQMQPFMHPDSNNVNIALRQPGAFVMPNGAYQMASGRPMQWPMAGQHSPPNTRADGLSVDGAALSASAGSPGRTPSANGMRAPQIARGATMPTATQVLNVSQGLASPAGAHIARLAPHSPSPHMLSPNLAAAHVNVHSSPTRTPQPAIPTPSPSMQSRQLVGGSGAAGY